MKAIFFNNIEAAKVLLRFGADTTIKNQVRIELRRAMKMLIVLL
jgi:hypothetical protein